MDIRPEPGTAQGYLGYGPVTNRRKAIPAGTELSFRAMGTSEQIAELQNCLRLLHLFGAIGGRSRRGWGSIEVVSDEGILPSAEPGEGFSAWAARVLRLVWPDAYGRPSLRRQPGFSRFSSQTVARYFDLPVDEGWEKGLDLFFQQFVKTRIYRRGGPNSATADRDHDMEWADADPDRLGESLSGVPARVAFGLPFAPTMKRGTPGQRAIRYEGYFRNENGHHKITRRASPLLLKIVRGPEQRLHGVALFLGSDFFGDRRARIQASVKTSEGWKRKSGLVGVPSYGAVTQYLANSDVLSWHEVPLP